MSQGLAVPLGAQEIAAAQRRIAGTALRTPLVPAGDTGVWLKLECLQPYGSYKIRGATNSVKALLETGRKPDVIVSASTGNFGQAIAAAGRSLRLPVIIHVPDNAARTKVDALRALGAIVREHSFDDWWRIIATRETPDKGVFIHPICDREVIAGAATVGEEIFADFPKVANVLIPIGGGGLACGIAQALRRTRPDCRIIAVETEVATPLRSAVEAGQPVKVERIPSFIDGMGSSRMLDEMWPLLERYIDDVIVVTVAEVEAAIRRLATDHRVIAEGAGAVAFAAALRTCTGRSVAVVSGGNLDWCELQRILAT